jgi:hypothetical protein
MRHKGENRKTTFSKRVMWAFSGRGFIPVQHSLKELCGHQELFCSLHILWNHISSA